MKQKSINSLAWSVMWRIIIVIAYYILLILLSIFILVAVFTFSIYIFWPLVPHTSSIYGLIIAIVAWGGLCGLALMFAAFLVKPLFSFTESSEIDNTIEVEREDCPELYEVISDVVKQTGTKMPKHVYLSPNDNACVFFDSSFWSIFLPIRKNLKIGLGLFNGLSVEEIKSILAHEFGHFSQDSMKVGSSVYVIHQVLYNMTYKRDGWDDLIDSWSTTNSDNWIANVFAFWGVLTRRMTDLVKRGNEMMFRFVHQKYMELSRQMEYDADNISCKCVGKECFISAMYKTDINSRNLRFFVNIMKDLIEEKKKVRNIFEAIEITNNTYYNDDPTLISYDHPLEESLLVDSRIMVNDARSSHPLLADRIKNANNNASKEAVKPLPAWNLIPKEIAIQISGIFYWAYEDYMKYQEISNEEYTSWLIQYLPLHYMPNKITPFFGRRIIPFDLTTPHENAEYPFTHQNSQLVNDYLVTQRDWDFILKIQNREIDTKNLYINGGSLNVLDFPIDDYKKHLSELSSLVCVLDKQVYHFLFHHCKEEDKERLDSSYYLLFYAEDAINGCLSSLINLSDLTKEKFNDILYSYGFKEELVYDLIEKYVINFNKIIKEIDPAAIDLVRDKGYLIDLQGSLAAYTEKGNLSKTEYLNLILFKLPQELIDIHNQLIVISQKSLSDIALDIINENKAVKENLDVKAPILTSNIETITIDHIEDKENAGLVVLLFASVLVLFLIVAYFFINPRETVVKTDSEVETTAPSYLNSEDANDPVELMKQKRDFTELSLCADKLTNVWVKCLIPEGLTYKRILSSDGSIMDAYEIFEDVSSPPYRIYFFTKDFFGPYDDDVINGVLFDCEMFINLDGVSKTGVWKKGNYSSNVTCYQKNLLYDTNPKTMVDIYILHPLGLECLCYFIYKREKVVDSPMYGILTSVRFEHHKRL